MSVFTEAELAFLQGERHLARLATVGPDGTPHIAPVGWSLDDGATVVRIGGNDLPSTKKFRDVARTGRAAVVIDDVLPPFRPRGVEVRGRAAAVREPEAMIVIYPERIVSWGLEGAPSSARDVS
jgi:pyridoxamine 5'-phosphate oxidase family protein